MLFRYKTAGIIYNPSDKGKLKNHIKEKKFYYYCRKQPERKAIKIFYSISYEVPMPQRCIKAYIIEDGF